MKLDLQGEDHDLRIAPTADIQGQIRMSDDGGPCAVHIGEGVTGKWTISVSGGAKVIIGEGSTCETALVAAQNTDVRIGADCMFSLGVEIRTTDTHAIYDVEAGERVNPDQAVVIGDHVWLGKQVMVLKGASIGSGSTVGVRAVVSGEIPALSVCAGVPARVVRSNAIWTRRIGSGRLEDDRRASELLEAIRAAS